MNKKELSEKEQLSRIIETQEEIINILKEKIEILEEYNKKLKEISTTF